MNDIRSRIAATAVAVALALATQRVAPARAQTMAYSAADRATVRAYVLTMDKIERYGRANDAIARDAPSDPALQRELATKQSPASLTAMFAVADHHPITLSYFRKEGLSDRDAILIPLVVINASVVSAQPSLAARLPVTPAQIAFVKAHYADLKDLHVGTE